MSTQSGAPEIAKWYTRARKFPQVIAKFPSGERLPFGPYTYAELISATVVALVAYQTRQVWGVFGALGNYGVIAGLVVATLLVVRALPTGTQGPLSWLTGVGNLLFAASPEPMRRPAKPRPARGVVAIDPRPPSPLPVLSSQPCASAQPRLSGVQQRLLLAAQGEESNA